MEGWKDPTTPIIWLISGCVILLIFVIFIFLMTKAHIQRIKREAKEKENLLIRHQKELLESTVESEEKEKKRIALQIHDELLPKMHRLKLINEDPEFKDLLTPIIHDLRQISHELTPPLLDELSFKAFAFDFLNAFEKKYEIEIYSNELNSEQLPSGIKLQLLRIFQELISNIDKHAKATRIEVQWRKTEKYCCLIVIDDGIGFDPEKSKKGLGFQNIETRAQIINGTYRFETGPKGGTHFKILIRL